MSLHLILFPSIATTLTLSQQEDDTSYDSHQYILTLACSFYAGAGGGSVYVHAFTRICTDISNNAKPIVNLQYHPPSVADKIVVY